MDTLLSRSVLIDLLQAALAAGEARFARQAALAWLAAYPGDLPVARWHAEALLREARRAPLSQRALHYASPVALLQSICLADPEFLPAQELLARALWETRRPLSGEPDQATTGLQAKLIAAAPAPAGLPRTELDVFGDVLALGGHLQPGAPAPEWGYALRQARRGLTASALTSRPGEAPGQAQKGVVLPALETGQRGVYDVLLRNPSTPLAAVSHLRFEAGRGQPPAALRSLAGVYHERWPGCVQFMLLFADACMESGETGLAVQMLHQAAALDVTGQVARRMWGEAHPYRSLWPERLEAPALKGLAVPAAVAAVLGWNRLVAGDAHPPHPGPLPEGEGVEGRRGRGFEEDEGGRVWVEKGKGDLRSKGEGEGARAGGNDWVQGGGALDLPIPALAPFSTRKDREESTLPAGKSFVQDIPLSIQAELERIAARLKQPQLGRMDGRFPVYVIFTTRSGLTAQYGPQAAARIEEGMLALAEAVRLRGGWGARLFYADEGLALPGAAPLIGLRQKSARRGDAWSLKLALADLDAALGKAGEMIGAVLLVGGPEVVPFHHLPNPVDDGDADVPSDNPYATRDENYFIPEWPVGRLPGGVGSDPALLLSTLENFAARHRQAARRRPFVVRWWEALGWLRPGRPRSSLGYTAEVWQKASQAVFRPAGDERQLLVSPPVQAGAACEAGGETAGAFDDPGGFLGPSKSNGRPVCVQKRLYPARLGYFNLHGLPDAAEWFGQRDPAGPLDGPDYPVALRPQDLAHANGRVKVPQVVFSEACYGAHIFEKGIEDALALKFMAAGSQAVVGATCIAYGAIADPLTAADLLGYAFWNYLRQGLPAGEALRRARIHLAREMHRRQGYLDGEDQKTLISFVLYGDPLAQPQGLRRRPKTILRPLHPPAQPKTVCDRVIVANPQSGPVNGTEDQEGDLPPEVLLAVKNVVADYLPGMSGARLRLSQEHAACAGSGHRCPTSQLGAKARPAHAPHRQVVTLQKSIPEPGGGLRRVHQHYARLTLDEGGRLVKLVVSR